jgi:molybdenum cofactor guanylyltransferase
MNGLDKGLQLYMGEPLIAHVLKRVEPQVSSVLISANRHINEYTQFGCDVFADTTQTQATFNGPLAGILEGLKHCKTPFMLCVPCDCPFLPSDLTQRLAHALHEKNADIAIACSVDANHNSQQQPVFALIKSCLKDDLASALHAGQRRVLSWMQQHQLVEVSFDIAQSPLAFKNFNYLEDLNFIA